MFRKSIKNKKVWPILILIGIVMLILGVVCARSLPADMHNMNMLMGMISGMGSAFAAVGIIKIIYYKKTPDEKLRKEEIELSDERNIQILRAAHSASSATATVLFAAMVCIFILLNYIVPAFISLGAMCIQKLAFFIANKHFNKKM